MNFNHSQDIPTTVGQSPGYDPKTSKRSSGLFSFFKWFKSSPSRESSVPDLLSSSSSSCDSINSRISTGTAASFSFVPPKSYQSNILEKKSIAPGPETDTYKARLKDRDKRRERDKNLTLRKKYNLFFNRETLLKPKVEEEEDSSRSLPLMTRKKMSENSDDETSRLHRRTNSESSKLKKAGAYCHVKGKRKAPQPPTNNKIRDSTLSLRRKKKLAPQPPIVSSEKIKSTLERLDTIEYADSDVICNDSLKLDHGVLKPVTEHTSAASIYSTDSASSVKLEKPMEISPVSPRPWYKRNVNRDSTFVPKKEPFKIDNKYEPLIQRVSESAKSSNATEENKSLKSDENLKPIKIFGSSHSSKDDFKRKSGMTFLTNISELDREATEMIKKEHCQSGELDPPPFMRPKQEEVKNTDSWISPKRKSAKDLIAKFNAITNVTKVTVNSTFFGSKESGGIQKDNFKRDYFGRQLSVKDELLHQNKNNKKLSDKYFGKIDQDEKKLIENNKSGMPLMKSESAVVITSNKLEKKETPKTERKSWNCPKCLIENEYWRIICHVCSTIKPYFDDLSIPSPKNNSLEKNKIENLEVKHFPASGSGSTDISKYTPFKSGNETPHFERSKTQIGFSALSKLNHNKNKEHKFSKSVSVDERAAPNITEDSKREERERLKKVLIEMKNSLPKKKDNIGKQNFRSSIIQEKSESFYEDPKKADSNGLNVRPNEISSNSAKLPVKVEDKNLITTPSAPEANVLKDNLKLSANSNSNIIIKVTGDNVLPQEKSAGIKVKLETKEKNLDKTQELTQKQSIVQTDKKEQLISNETKKQNLSNDNRAVNKKPHEVEPQKEKVAEAFIKTTETIYENIKVKKPDNPKPTKVSSAVQTNGVLRKFSPDNTLDAAKDAKKNPTYELLRPNDFANIYNQKMDSRDENHIYANLIQNGSLFLNMPVNFEDIRNNVANNTDTLEIGRLLKRLELAIAMGELGEAANYARELAQLKVNCSVIRQKSEEEKATARAEDKGFTIHMYVEDKISHRGPFPIKVRGSTTVSQLKMRVERDFEIPSNVQKWIIGKQLASDDNATMNELNIYDEGSPLFLYLVAPQKNEIKNEPSASSSGVKLLDKDKEKNKSENRIQLPSTSKQSEEKKIENKLHENKNAPDIIGSNKPKESVSLPSYSKIPVPEVKPDVLDSKTPIIIGKDINKTPNENITDVNNAIATEPKQVQRTKEDIDDYDTRTLKPHNDEFWECIMCTLINSKDSNVCAVCATIRRMTPSPTATPNQPQKIARNRTKYKAPQPQANANSKEHYMQLVNLDNADFVENVKAFECLICFLEVEPGQGVTLRECLHQFCKPCLAHTIQFCEEAQVKCPYRDEQYSCEIALQDREIKALVTKEIYDQYLGKSVAQAENKIDKSFHCKTPDCRGWCIYEDNVNEFKCPVCRRVNCLTCQAIHIGLNCKQYQERMEQESSTDENAKRTRQMLDEMVNKGEALTCPTCQVILMKKWGCDWLRCSMCKTEICWVTRGPRWGPGGKGDTSGGCQCGVNGIKCHPQCNYCH